VNEIVPIPMSEIVSEFLVHVDGCIIIPVHEDCTISVVTTAQSSNILQSHYPSLQMLGRLSLHYRYHSALLAFTALLGCFVLWDNFNSEVFAQYTSDS
jgi:hypothetical protein